MVAAVVATRATMEVLLIPLLLLLLLPVAFFALCMASNASVLKLGAAGWSTGRRGWCGVPVGWQRRHSVGTLASQLVLCLGKALHKTLHVRGRARRVVCATAGVARAVGAQATSWGRGRGAHRRCLLVAGLQHLGHCRRWRWWRDVTVVALATVMALATMMALATVMTRATVMTASAAVAVAVAAFHALVLGTSAGRVATVAAVAAVVATVVGTAGLALLPFVVRLRGATFHNMCDRSLALLLQVAQMLSQALEHGVRAVSFRVPAQGSNVAAARGSQARPPVGVGT